MKFATIQSAAGLLPVLVSGDELVVLADTFKDINAVVEGGRDALEIVAGLLDSRIAKRVPIAGAVFSRPITRFRRDVLCTGWNYWDHFEEGKEMRAQQDMPKAPTFFTKSPDTVCGPNDQISVDQKISQTWDYEAEMALVFGKTGRSIPRAYALDHVFGYMLANDVSQRDLQRRHGGQWMKGKSIDATMPLGPFLVTPDEFDPQDERIELLLNGTVMQSASTRQMAFAIPDLIAEISLGMTVRSGDVLLTGTPSGVGQSRKPPVFLKDGDEVVIRSGHLGEQRNVVREVDLQGASDVVIEV
ncbi:fumarylacetoacetate hydrolase family protein [Rhizobium rhizogenes]|uniref:fumarylacetoacetate hydrolase family protein n=1 Tax=Rhizobium rhizogenes TaxID=359 RepID=UPI00157338C0|nr:fumarylacetoacetate hydrolase family protein [Rhizobium rhizogenes]NTF96008.1 fumarylacetoacetate hydrolase family protein [Rhizobium rhizogenes]